MFVKSFIACKGHSHILLIIIWFTQHPANWYYYAHFIYKETKAKKLGERSSNLPRDLKLLSRIARTPIDLSLLQHVTHSKYVEALKLGVKILRKTVWDASGVSLLLCKSP